MASSSAPNDRKYLESHEWHQVSGDTVTIGITQIAADELTDITFVQLPKVGAKVEAGKAFGEIESVKATSDLYSGVSGTVTDVNPKLSSEPGVINQDPYGAGWMIKVKADDVKQVDKLLPVDEYLKKTGH
jgi:glycine cleavage system H protein